MKTSNQPTYICPMHSDVISTKPGKCPKCGGMDLVLHSEGSEQKKSKIQTFLPLILIVGLLVVLSAVQVVVLQRHAATHTGMSSSVHQAHIVSAGSSGSSSVSDWHVFMTTFMGGFFIVFAAFKLLDLKGFARGFQTYDIAAAKWPSYGYLYPFVELGLGFCYLLSVRPTIVNVVTLIFTLFGATGIWQKLRKKEKIHCVCLGTAFNLPLTNVTLLENLVMSFMSGWMLIAAYA